MSMCTALYIHLVIKSMPQATPMINIKIFMDHVFSLILNKPTS